MVQVLDDNFQIFKSDTIQEKEEWAETEINSQKRQRGRKHKMGRGSLSHGLLKGHMDGGNIIYDLSFQRGDFPQILEVLEGVPRNKIERVFQEQRHLQNIIGTGNVRDKISEWGMCLGNRMG